MSKSDHKHSNFGGKSPGLGQGPGLLDYGFKIPNRTIGVQIPTEHRAEFQFSMCKSGQKIGGQTT
jgi:hypothetical protein